MTKFHQGQFIPKHPEKYVGDPTNIRFRSGWEKKCMVFFDENPSVISWNSEGIMIPYLCATDGRQHRYYPDFLVKFKKRDGTIVTTLIEVKPLKQTKPPVQPKRRTKRFLQEVETYAKNRSKWDYAIEWCKQKGIEFTLLTEVHIRP